MEEFSARISQARAKLYDVVAAPDGDVAEGALWIAAEEYPELEVGRYLDYLAELSERVRLAAGPAPDEEAWRTAFNEQLFLREGFAGNAEDYDDPRNSYLNDVIDRRRGIPITLSIVYLAVARRLGLAVSGVNAPGHFLLRHGEMVVDPFHGGRAIEPELLVERLTQGTGDPHARVQQLLNHPPNVRTILTRVLANLRMNHLRRSDESRALQVVDRLVSIDPANPAWIRDRAVLFRRLDCPRAALADFESYLQRVPDDPDAQAIREVITLLSADLPPLH